MQMRKRLQHEAAQVGARMGNDEAHLIDPFDAVIDDVQIERARGMDSAQGRSSALHLEVLQAAEKIQRRQKDGVDFDFGEGIEKGRRAGRAVDGRRFDSRRFAHLVVGGKDAEEGDSRWSSSFVMVARDRGGFGSSLVALL